MKSIKLTWSTTDYWTHQWFRDEDGNSYCFETKEVEKVYPNFVERPLDNRASTFEFTEDFIKENNLEKLTFNKKSSIQRYVQHLYGDYKARRDEFVMKLGYKSSEQDGGSAELEKTSEFTDEYINSQMDTYKALVHYMHQPTLGRYPVDNCGLCSFEIAKVELFGDLLKLKSGHYKLNRYMQVVSA